MWPFKKRPVVVAVKPGPTPRDYAFSLQWFVESEFSGNKTGQYSRFTLKDAEVLADLYPDVYQEYLDRWMRVLCVGEEI